MAPQSAAARFRANDGFDRWLNRTDTAMLVLSVLFVGLLVLPLAVQFGPRATGALGVANAVVWLIFAVDYAARVYLSPERWQFVRAHRLDLIIVLLPLLRPLRALRILQLARAGSVAASARGRVKRSFHAEVTMYVVSAVMTLLVLAAAGVLHVESRAPEGNIDDFGDALWWAAATVATVGYGDKYPTTGWGRAIAMMLMVFGIAMLGVVTAAVAAWFVERLQQLSSRAPISNSDTEAAELKADPLAHAAQSSRAGVVTSEDLEGRGESDLKAPALSTPEGIDGPSVGLLLREIRALHERLDRIEGSRGPGERTR